MPNTRRYYRNIDEGEEEELSIKFNCPCVEGEIYINTEYGDTPCWIEVTLRDEGVLMMKMARGLLQDFKDFSAIELWQDVMNLDISEEWGNFADARLKIYDHHAWVQFYAKHSTEMVEVNVSDQFNQAIGV